jgi:hypothetical protein
MTERRVTWAADRLACYEVRGSGIYTRKYNVRLATFANNSAALRTLLAEIFDTAHKIVQARHLTDADIRGKKVRRNPAAQRGVIHDD